MEKLLATRSVIARPTDTGYAGVCVQWDGYPSDRLSLLLTAHRYRFGGDLDALARHLIDEAPEGWGELGTDLLDGAPASLRTELVGDDDRPSSKHDAMVVITIGDVGPELHTFTEQSSGDLDWGYVLHPHGIEVISLHAEARGPVVGWDTDPRTRFSNSPYRWRPGNPIPVTRPTRAVATAPPTPPARTATPQPVPRR
ncbi:hypothetical protein [Streptomyces sp. SP18BB07]|uniref:hypothetical protein n=1 Tax=Streptomyces sp. SP18BB07 TaxID=3002522 RepID=UPI002E77087F|nr:hypothetical protein [Streptomyces sp. SP18BB07]MEE1765293.1 hypothetical protein [Streptomyces sp. SP18BB07]